MIPAARSKGPGADCVFIFQGAGPEENLPRSTGLVGTSNSEVISLLFLVAQDRIGKQISSDWPGGIIEVITKPE